jgi:hypothetical protein
MKSKFALFLSVCCIVILPLAAENTQKSQASSIARGGNYRDESLENRENRTEDRGNENRDQRLNDRQDDAENRQDDRIERR